MSVPTRRAAANDGDGARARLRAALRHPGFASGSLEIDGCRIHHRVSAATLEDGPTYVLVHGLIVSGRYMMPLALCLAGHGRVLVPDLPGFGGSEKPQPPPQVPELARRLAGYLGAVGARPVVLVANSFGCQVVAAMAAERPEVFAGPAADCLDRTRPALAIEPAPTTGPNVSAETRPSAVRHVFAETSPVIAPHGSAEMPPVVAPSVAGEALPAAGSRASAESSGPAGLVARVVLVGPTVDPAARSALRQIGRLILSAPHEPFEYPALLAADLLRVGLLRGARAFRAALADRVEESLPRVPVPTLVVRGSRDPITPHRWAEQAARLLPRGRLVEIPDGGHALNYGAADALARIVRAFAAESDPAEPSDSREAPIRQNLG
ncbi:MAG TPA: alpha/beta hydrolase [Thermoanaerobaculia bacterium]|nr:alpha/beta hydrolase [Thermoanaerobaculia bacterium]